MRYDADDYSVVMSPDGRFLVGSPARTTVEVRRLPSAELVTTISAEPRVRRFAVSADGRLLLGADPRSGPLVRAWHLPSGEAAGALPRCPVPTEYLTVTPDGVAIAASAGTYGRLMVWPPEPALMGHTPAGEVTAAEAERLRGPYQGRPGPAVGGAARRAGVLAAPARRHTDRHPPGPVHGRHRGNQMSHFTTLTTQLTDTGALRAALADAGYRDIEVHDQPQPLYGYAGDRRADRAHVIIRRRHVGRLSNDIGFRHQDDGKFLAVISEYDRAKHDERWLGQLTARHTYHLTTKTLTAQGFDVVTETADRDGTVRMVLRRFH